MKRKKPLYRFVVQQPIGNRIMPDDASVAECKDNCMLRSLCLDRGQTVVTARRWSGP
ncbi:hypothetical protein [Hungatella hominis]|uniref:Uncharacterized protein n=1 Tax=Hungatella hominis TaxID=2763050 RepID=A0ABR7H5P5_9FIRM|nr:hypothetical protein [Hungatella hominis]MBC5708515.1 hypothetical protein [Hungatella hominis]